MLTDSRLVIKRRAAVPIKRKLYVINFIGDERVKFGVNNADIDTLRTSLMLRMYYCEIGGVVVTPHLPEQELVNTRLVRAEKALLKYLRGSKPATMEDIVLMYRSRKRKIYEQALSEYYLYGCQRSDSVSTSFVKCEKTNVTKAPRNIQPRKPIYNLELATWLKPLEKRVQKTFKRMFGQHTILKGYDANILGDIMHQKWDSFKEPVAIGLDAVKFDMHFSPAVLNWEHQIYNKIFGDHRLRQLLTWQMHNIGRGRCYDGSLRYRVKGKRFSGDINTSMGNCLVMCSIIYCYFKEFNINGQLANNGDDCVIFVEKVDLDRLKTIEEWFNDLGFRVTLEEPVYLSEEIEFCQCHPLYINNHWRMVRNIPTAMSKDSASVYDFPNERSWRKWLYQVGECGLALASGVPVLQEFYLAYMRNGTQCTRNEHYFANSGMAMMAEGMSSQVSLITTDARWGVFVAWDITPDEQVMLEEHYRTLVINYGDEVVEPSDIVGVW